MEYGAGVKQRLTVHRIAAKAGIECRRMLAPLLIRRSPLCGATFTGWDDAELPYFCHRHNLTWRNERAIEIPVVVDFLRRHGRGVGLEFGNVLNHYGLGENRTVVDRYEAAEGVTNIDVLDIDPNARFDYIVSISTLEHVGWDEGPRDPDKAGSAYEYLRSLLSTEGRMLITVPLGHHDRLDELVATGQLATIRQMTLIRESDGWRRFDGVERHPYEIGRGARAVWIAEVGPIIPTTAAP
jgi:hypothetical protein